MRAIAIDSTGSLDVVEAPEPHVGPGMVKVEMLAGGVCGSDLGAIDANIGVPGSLRVLGHEGGGRVVKVADDVRSVRVGDTVVIEPNYACLRCAWCLSGQSKMCPDRVVVGRDVPGIFSEFAVVPAEFVWRLPTDTPARVLAAFEPAVVARVAVESTALADDARILVVGAGSQGQAVVGTLREAGVTPFVAEPIAARLDRAVEQGACPFEAHDGANFDFVFETSGVQPGFELAMRTVNARGTICLIGQSSVPFPLITREVVQKELVLRGSVIYNHPQDFRSAVESFESGRFSPDVAMRVGVGPREALGELLHARRLDGKLWIDFSDWNR